MNHAIEYFSRQFDRQVRAADYALNMFEQRALRHLEGDLLDLGCGMGNLALAAAARGHAVTACDGCRVAVADLQRRAAERGLVVDARCADLTDWTATRTWDSVVSIGLLMFLDREGAWRLLGEIERAVRPGGLCVLNACIEGTTFMAMFDARAHCLFAPDALVRRFSAWHLIEHRIDEAESVEPGLIKRTATLIARRPLPA